MIFGVDAKTSSREAPFDDQAATRDGESLVWPGSEARTARKEIDDGELKDCRRGVKKGRKVSSEKDRDVITTRRTIDRSCSGREEQKSQMAKTDRRGSQTYLDSE